MTENVWHPRAKPCAWCHKPLRAEHPPYLITKDSKIYGPYHTDCLDAATRKIDPEAWQRRHAYAARQQVDGKRRE